MVTINKMYFLSLLTGSLFDRPLPFDPPDKKVLNALVKFGAVFRSLPEKVAALHEDEVVRVLSDASRAARLVGYSSPGAQRTVVFLERMVFMRLMTLERRKDPALREKIAELNEAWSNIRALKGVP